MLLKLQSFTLEVNQKLFEQQTQQNQEPLIDNQDELYNSPINDDYVNEE
jgi:hypothetical protein